MVTQEIQVTNAINCSRRQEIAKVTDSTVIQVQRRVSLTHLLKTWG